MSIAKQKVEIAGLCSPGVFTGFFHVDYEKNYISIAIVNQTKGKQTLFNFEHAMATNAYLNAFRL